MKKTIILGLTLLTFSMPFMASAQVVNSSFNIDQQAEIASLKAELVTLITQLIAVLQAQIVEIQQAQASQQAQIDAITAGGASTGSVQTPIAQPVVAAPTPSITISVLPMGCEAVTADITGAIWTQAVIDMQDGTKHQRASISPTARLVDVQAGNYSYTIDVWTGSTAPFTEGTWQDTRQHIAESTGNVSVAACN